MVAIPLRSGAYSAASLIADAQRCINMFPEENPEKTKPNMPTTHYVRPGLRFLNGPVTTTGGPLPIPPANNVLSNDAGTKILTTEGGVPLTP